VRAPVRESIERVLRGSRGGRGRPGADAGDRRAAFEVAPDGTPIDILARLGEAFEFSDLEAVVHNYGDVPVKVATAGTLYRMKRDTVRLRDKADAQILKEKFGLND
jgi:hypothetical protein